MDSLRESLDATAAGREVPNTLLTYSFPFFISTPLTNPYV